MLWPLQSQCDAFYGNPRGSNGQASTLWKLRNLTTVKAPFVMRYAGQPIKGVTIHRKCAASLARVFQAIWIASGKSQAVIDKWGVSTFGGSFNFRPMRGSTHLSMHSYGCAIDLDPTHHQMTHGSALFDPRVIKAFADEGWVNLPNDRMHFQAARLSGAPVSLTAKPQPIIGEPAMATATNKVVNVNTLNIGSIGAIAAALGYILPKAVELYGTNGLVAAGVLVVGCLIQFFMPPATAKAIENAVIAAIPVAEALAPAYKADLEAAKTGLQTAETVVIPPSA